MSREVLKEEQSSVTDIMCLQPKFQLKLKRIFLCLLYYIMWSNNIFFSKMLLFLKWVQPEVVVTPKT